MTDFSDWSNDTPTEPGIYWALGEAGGWPAYSLFRIELERLDD